MSAAPQAGKSAALPTVGSVAPPSDRTVDRVRRGTKDLPSLDLGDRLAAAADDDHEVPHMVLTNRSILTYTVDKQSVTVDKSTHSTVTNHFDFLSLSVSRLFAFTH